jgi:excisionase family DNA binding protein
MEQETKLVLSVAETAKPLGISGNLCYDLVRRREIPALRLGRRLLVPRKALEDLLVVQRRSDVVEPWQKWQSSGGPVKPFWFEDPEVFPGNTAVF